MMSYLNSRKYFLGRILGISAILLSILLISVAPLAAIDKQPSDRMFPARYSMIGIRLGGWIDQGGEINDPDVEANFSKGSFYTELFYDHRFTPALMLEISLGVISRGDAEIAHGNDSFIGNINVYPFLFQLKFSPLAASSRSFHPFLVGGGGFAFGSQRVDIILSDDSYWDPYDSESESNFAAVIGGGIDFPISGQLALNLTGKYHWIEFKDELFGIKDYSGTAISVGISYLLHKN